MHGSKPTTQRFDGVIVNGVWQYHGVAARRALAGRKRYVVFAHGMLDPYFKDRYPLKHLKKLVYWTLHEHRNLNYARGRLLHQRRREARRRRRAFPSAIFKRRRRALRHHGPGPATPRR